ncbi:uncharacterized protein LOC142165297 [Nicotiana tabacum]|uniref:Uncharacterized protein LOC142165297 n=1 Tax=Nicotiana tabacum TaxID=4097 RepID=A0AC58S4V9_TOBAC
MGSVGVSPTVRSSSTSSIVEPSHPLYVYPSDSPGTILVTESFNGTGYGGWRRSMLIGLSCENKLGIINGTVAEPNENSPLFESWCRCNNMVTAWILNSLETEIRESVMYTESAQKLWKEIEQRYGRPNGTKLFQIRKDLASISQGSSNIASYFNRIKKLWDELAYSISYPECTCGCKEAFQKLEDEKSVYAMLIEDEIQIEVQPVTPSFSTDLASFSTGVQKPYTSRVNFDASNKVNFDASRKENSNMVCRYCKKPGHSIDKCYKLHGYPPGSSSKYKRTTTYAHVSDPSRAGVPDNHHHVTEGPKAVPLDIEGNILSKEQYDQLVSLLQLSKQSSTSQDLSAASANFAGLISSVDFSNCISHACNFSKVDDSLWIIDSGATNHMTPHKSLLTDITLLPLPYLVTLPNGYKVKVTCTGSLFLSPTISLPHVLLGLFLKKPLVLGKLQKGLYIPQSNAFCDSDFSSLFSVNTITANVNNLNKSSFTSCSSVSAPSDIVLPGFNISTVSTFTGKKAYKLPNLSTSAIFHSRDVVFHEHIFPYSNSSSTHLFPPPAPSSPTTSSFSVPSPPSSTPSYAPSSSVPSFIPPHNPTTSAPPLRRSGRTTQTPGYLSDYVCTYVSDSKAIPSSSSESFQLEPQFYHQAASNPAWQEAMMQEFQALEANNTWSIVPLPSGKKVIPCKWVYKIKQKVDGSIERYKARLVIKGDNQQEGVDFTETFSPVVKLTIVRCLLTKAIKRNWVVYQLDVNNAFLHGDLDEEVYIQASRQWYAKLSAALQSKGFQPSLNDYSLFTKLYDGCLTVVVVYVDDILVSKDSLSEIDSLKRFLDAQFKIKDLGEIHYFLGLEVVKQSSGFLINQHKFLQDLLLEFHCSDVTLLVSPLDPHIKLSYEVGNLLSNPLLYRQLVGKLNFLQHTRPDISYTVQHLSQFMSAPRLPHLVDAYHVLRYLSDTPTLGISLSHSPDFGLKGYCDSDWAGCVDSKRSVSGFILFLGGFPISWKSKKQLTLALSSAEAKYRVIRLLVAEVVWVVRLLNEFGLANLVPVEVYCDSQSSIHIAKNPVFHERTKHIEVDCHFVRDALKSGLISLHPTSTSSQIVDVFTKSLLGVQQQGFISKLGMSSPSSLRGATRVPDLS